MNVRDIRGPTSDKNLPSPREERLYEIILCNFVRFPSRSFKILNVLWDKCIGEHNDVFFLKIHKLLTNKI